MRIRIRNNRGDTLVEVLLATAVLAAVIGIAYGTAARAQRNTQLVQQRSEATQIASTQLERLRRIRDDASSTEVSFRTLLSRPGVSASFCIPNSVVSPNPPVTPSFDDQVVDAAGGCSEGIYSRQSSYSSNTITTVVSWQGNGPNIQHNVTLRMRIW